MTHITKPLDRTLMITTPTWAERPDLEGFVASFLLYGNARGEPPEGGVAFFKGLRLVGLRPVVPVTLERIIFNARCAFDPPTSAMRFNDKGEMSLARGLKLAGKAYWPIVVPGVSVEVELFSPEAPDHPVRVQPIFQKMSAAQALQWFMENAARKP